jgi:3-phenylpropionate/trans-cinnamate dioxygenase ferredoxin reductase subunit
MSAGTLIVGASQAGLQVAVSLRELGDNGPITLIGEEVHAPYQRPPLSKSFLHGTADVNSLAFRSPGFYAEAKIELVRGDRVTDLALSPTGSAGSGTATTGSGRVLAFDRLALTVGAAPRRLALPGAHLEGVCYLRDVDDAALLRSRLASARHVVVVGGGFIGLETAALARSQGKVVTVVEAADRLISRAVAPLVSEFFQKAHTRRGTTVLVSVGVSAFSGDRGRVTGVHLSDGTELPADLVLVGVGAVPRTELAEQIGVKCDGGIVVDSYARTSESSIVAAGDCTVLPNPLTGLGRVRLESVQNAVAQARVAASSLIGRPEHTPTVPWFWSDQDDLKLQIAGLADGYDDYVVRGEPDSERYSILYYRDKRLIAVHAVNRPADYMAVRKALTDGASIPADKAADTNAALKTLFVDADADSVMTTSVLST